MESHSSLILPEVKSRVSVLSPSSSKVSTILVKSDLIILLIILSGSYILNNSNNTAVEDSFHSHPSLSALDIKIVDSAPILDVSCVSTERPFFGT